jgi:hypothetical protein
VQSHIQCSHAAALDICNRNGIHFSTFIGIKNGFILILFSHNL